MEGIQFNALQLQSMTFWKQNYHEGMALDLCEVAPVEFMLLCYLGLHLVLWWELSNSLQGKHPPFA